MLVEKCVERRRKGALRRQRQDIDEPARRLDRHQIGHHRIGICEPGDENRVCADRLPLSLPAGVSGCDRQYYVFVRGAILQLFYHEMALKSAEK